jgi:hypothetical protein
MGLKLDINPERRKSKTATEVTTVVSLGTRTQQKTVSRATYHPSIMVSSWVLTLPSIHHGELMGADSLQTDGGWLINP